MIQRLNPDFDYLDPAELHDLGVSQVVIANGVVHWSGVVAAKGSLRDVTIPAADMAGQLAFILDRLDACLTAVGSDRTHILTLTIYTTQLGELSASLPALYAPWIGAHRPTLTCLGVAQLAFPEALLEIQGSALVPR